MNVRLLNDSTEPADVDAVANEQKNQEEIANDMAGMMAQFKEGVATIGDDMSADAHVLKKQEELMEENMNKISAARKQIEVQNESGIGFCATTGIILMCTLLFIGTYIFIRIFPK